VRALLYGLCGPIAVWSFVSFATFAWGERPYLDFRARTFAWSVAAMYGTAIAQIITCVGVVAVLWRNYRIAQVADERRRLRWVLWGTIAGVAPFLSVAVMRLIAIGVPSLMPMIAPWIFVANVATILIPFSFAYAIAKHHVFDITVVLRRGVQYLLAQNALRGLVSLPLIGLGVGVVRHRNEPIGLLLVSHSPYLYLAVGAALSLQFRGQLSRWIDRRFFREAYDRERMLLNLMSDAERLDSGSAMWKVVSHELQSAFHPTKRRLRI
jgi:sigma-B regulation protein RsbU (phosphoserine phosphatase)